MDDIRVARIFDALSGGDRCAWMKQGRCGLAGPGWAGCWCYSRAQEVDAALPAEPALPAILRAHDRRVTELLEANNREVERRRAAEARVAELEAALLRAQHPLIMVSESELRYGDGPRPASPPIDRAYRAPFNPLASPLTAVDPLNLQVPAGAVARINELAEDRVEWDAQPRW